MSPEQQELNHFGVIILNFEFSQHINVLVISGFEQTFVYLDIN